jgi:hypothetical protein
LNLLKNLVIFKCIGVNEWEILLHEGNFLLIVTFFHMAVPCWNSENYLLRFDSSLYEALDAAICVQRSAIEDTILNSLLVC